MGSARLFLNEAGPAGRPYYSLIYLPSAASGPHENQYIVRSDEIHGVKGRAAVQPSSGQRTGLCSQHEHYVNMAESVVGGEE